MSMISCQLHFRLRPCQNKMMNRDKNHNVMKGINMDKSREKLHTRKLRSLQTRKKLLEAARDLFIEHGFQKATISQIIKKIATLWKYVSQKRKRQHLSAPPMACPSSCCLFTRSRSNHSFVHLNMPVWTDPYPFCMAADRCQVYRISYRNHHSVFHFKLLRLCVQLLPFLRSYL